MNFLKTIATLMAAFFTVFANAQSSNLPAQAKAITTIKALVVEQTYLMTIQKLTIPLILNLDRASIPIDGKKYPHSVLQEQFISMKNGDYKSFMGTWTKGSQTEMYERNNRINKPETFWIELWKKDLKKANTIEVRNLIAYGRYVLIDYILLDSDGKPLVTDTIATIKEGDAWFATQALAQDPILTQWNNPAGRIQIPPSSMIIK